MCGAGVADYTHTRLAQLAALQLPGVGMATAIDLGDMKSPNGGIHPRLKQEVGRRLALTARAVQYMEPGVVFQGPKLEGAYLSNADGTQVTLTFATATAAGLHLAGTAGCVDCCKTPHSKPWYVAFETQAPNGTWLGAVNQTVRRNTVTVTSPVPISGVRAGYGGYPDCLLYNGAGGANDHAGLVAPPFRRCLYGATASLPAWNWLSDCNPAPTNGVAYSPGGAPVPTSSGGDFILGATQVVHGVADDASSGAALSSGVPKGGAVFVARYGIDCGPAASKLLDSVQLTFRYRAAPVNASRNNTPAVIKIGISNGDNRPVATVATETIGNYTGAAFSPPVRVGAKGLKASCGAGLGSNPRGRLFVTFQVTNNDRPVLIPVDDRAGGFDLRVGWV